MKKILVPIDFSKSSIAALDVACSIAKKFDSNVVALHVVEGASSESFKISGEGTPNNAEEKLYNYKLLERSQDLLRGLVLSQRYSSVKLDGEMRMGNVFHGIQNIIKSRKTDLVIMGAKGYSEWEEMLIGSNTEKVIRCSNVPVLAIHKKPTRISFKRIVYATTVPMVKEHYFPPVLRKLQQLYKSKIHFVHVNTPGDFHTDVEVFPLMEKAATKMKLSNYSLHVYNDFSAEDGIVHFANQINADLIAMSSRGRTGLSRLMIGSISRDVMNHFKRPTLVYVPK